MWHVRTTLHSAPISFKIIVSKTGFGVLQRIITGIAIIVFWQFQLRRTDKNLENEDEIDFLHFAFKKANSFRFDSSFLVRAVALPLFDHAPSSFSPERYVVQNATTTQFCPYKAVAFVFSHLIQIRNHLEKSGNVDLVRLLISVQVEDQFEKMSTVVEIVRQRSPDHQPSNDGVLPHQTEIMRLVAQGMQTSFIEKVMHG